MARWCTSKQSVCCCVGPILILIFSTRCLRNSPINPPKKKNTPTSKILAEVFHAVLVVSKCSEDSLFLFSNSVRVALSSSLHVLPRSHGRWQCIGTGEMCVLVNKQSVVILGPGKYPLLFPLPILGVGAIEQYFWLPAFIQARRSTCIWLEHTGQDDRTCGSQSLDLPINARHSVSTRPAGISECSLLKYVRYGSFCVLVSAPSMFMSTFPTGRTHRFSPPQDKRPSQQGTL